MSLADLPEVSKAIAVIVSVMAFVLSWRANKRSTYVSTSQIATNLMLDVDRQFLEHSELRPYFYDKEPSPPPGQTAPTTRNQVKAMAEFMLDALECILDQAKHAPYKDMAGWADYANGMFGTSPALLEMYNENQPEAWYPTLTRLRNNEYLPRRWKRFRF